MTQESEPQETPVYFRKSPERLIMEAKEAEIRANMVAREHSDHWQDAEFLLREHSKNEINANTSGAITDHSFHAHDSQVGRQWHSSSTRRITPERLT